MNRITPDFTAPPAPKRELDLLVNYLSGRFATERTAISELLSHSPRSRGELFTLSRRALAFRHELAGWSALAARAHEEMLADQLDLAHDERSAELADAGRGALRPTAELVRARARQHVAPLSEALEILRSTRDDMGTVISWAQTMIRVVTDEELTGEAAGVTDAPAEIYEPPIGSALRTRG